MLIRPVLGQGHRKGKGCSIELLLHFGYFECSAVYGKLIVAYLAAIAGNAFCPREYQYVAFQHDRGRYGHGSLRGGSSSCVKGKAFHAKGGKTGIFCQVFVIAYMLGGVCGDTARRFHIRKIEEQGKLLVPLQAAAHRQPHGYIHAVGGVSPVYIRRVDLIDERAHKQILHIAAGDGVSDIWLHQLVGRRK